MDINKLSKDQFSALLSVKNKLNHDANLCSNLELAILDACRSTPSFVVFSTQEEQERFIKAALEVKQEAISRLQMISGLADEHLMPDISANRAVYNSIDSLITLAKQK